MRLISLKTCKVPAIVICMLAAGICYSCGGHPDPSVGSGYEGIVLELGDSGSGQDGLGKLDSGQSDPGRGIRVLGRMNQEIRVLERMNQESRIQDRMD